MNHYLFTAGCLTFVVGIIHSVLGELLIFHQLRNHGIIPTNGGSILSERNVRILWATWHLVTLFGLGIGTILLILSISWSQDSLVLYIENTLLISMALASALVLVATKAKHPGWMGLLCVAILVWAK